MRGEYLLSCIVTAQLVEEVGDDSGGSDEPMYSVCMLVTFDSIVKPSKSRSFEHLYKRPQH